MFESRLPDPLRVGTLQNPEEEHKALLKLVLQPVANRLAALQRDVGSELKKALDSFEAVAKKPVEEERTKVIRLKDDSISRKQRSFPTFLST